MDRLQLCSRFPQGDKFATERKKTGRRRRRKQIELSYGFVRPVGKMECKQVRVWSLSLVCSFLIYLSVSSCSAKQLEPTRRMFEEAKPLEQVASSHYYSETEANEERKQTGAPLRLRRYAPAPPMALLMPINELRISGSKNEPPSRPTVDWSKQRPYFGPDLQRNVSVELGKTAYLTCKVYELGDKTVSWLRPRENEILTAGRYTYIGDPRFASINDNGSHDWILEIKDVGLNDSTSYECQVSTDPKMSTIINLHVKASKARIKQGEQFYAAVGSNIEFTCEVAQRIFSSSSSSQTTSSSVQQTYWYFNGNLLNYARTQNFTIDWDPITQTSRFKLSNIQSNDAGNYTCKPTSSEPTTIRLHVKKHNKSSIRDRAHIGNGYQSTNAKEAQRNRQLFGLDSNSAGLEYVDSGATTTTTLLVHSIIVMLSLLISMLTLRY